MLQGRANGSSTTIASAADLAKRKHVYRNRATLVCPACMFSLPRWSSVVAKNGAQWCVTKILSMRLLRPQVMLIGCAKSILVAVGDGAMYVFLRWRGCSEIRPWLSAARYHLALSMFEQKADPSAALGMTIA
jgi:hypothetical protein